MSDRGSGWWPEEPDSREGGSDPGGSGAGAEGGQGPPDEAEGRKGSERERATTPPGRRPPRGLGSRDKPKLTSRYSLFVGLAFVVIALVAVINAISTDEGGITGADRDSSRGESLPEFALPVIPGPAAGDDANIASDDCESSRNPCPEDQVRTPACEIETEGAIRVCDLFDRPLAISFWFTRGGDCLGSQDAFDRVASQRGEEVNFLSVNVLDDAESVAEIVAEREWEVAVGHDADGAVSNITGVGVCPTILLVYPGGILHAAEIKPGNFSVAEIDAMVDDLLRASGDREPRGRA